MDKKRYVRPNILVYMDSLEWYAMKCCRACSKIPPMCPSDCWILNEYWL